MRNLFLFSIRNLTPVKDAHFFFALQLKRFAKRNVMLVDRFGRTIDYLRVSVTERCNFRCRYCMPDKPFEWVPRENLLSYEELFAFIRIAIDNGVRKIRITGGEPTLREDLDQLIKMIHDYKSDLDLALTTNGYLLEGMAQKLKDAGLKRVNISLDSLDSVRLAFVTQRDVLDAILKGINKALEVGLKVKINAVAMKGINDTELCDLLAFCKEKKIMIRFIEYMENSHASTLIKGMRSDDILKELQKKYHFVRVDSVDGGPARLYEMPDGYRFGIIEPHKDDFCQTCNRLRLTAEGYLIPCLYFDEAVNLKEAARSNDKTAMQSLLEEAVHNKPEKNRWGNESEVSSRAFFETGG